MLIIAKCSYYSNYDWIIYFYNEQNQLHRNDGAAIINSDDFENWYQNGMLHREDGPAIENFFKKPEEGDYYLNGKRITKEEFENFRILKDLQDSIKKELKS